LGQQIKDIRKRMLKHLDASDRDTWVRALMCLFIDHTCARIGNIASTKNAKKTYGVTTLLTKKHAKVYDDRVVISYRGKHDQPQKHTLLRYRTKDTVEENPVEYAIAEKLAVLIEEKNEQIFTHENGKPFTPQSVNEYFRATKADPENGLPEGGAGSPCTVHTLRNYHATEMFRQFAEYYAVKQKKTPAYPDVVAAYQGRSKTKTRSSIKGIIEKIAKMLGNTPAICRKSYIEPRDQLLFFKRWDYRPPDGLIHDLFVDEAFDTYGLEGKPTSRKRYKFDDDRGKISQARQKVTT
jgi:DNA topoisomerase IB